MKKFIFVALSLVLLQSSAFGLKIPHPKPSASPSPMASPAMPK